MEGEHLIIHIVDGDSRRRADQARLVMALGHHAEVYADLAELLAHPPMTGIIIASDQAVQGGATTEHTAGIFDLLDAMGEAGIWLPVIATAENPSVDRAVDVLRAGVFDYLGLPLQEARLSEALVRVTKEAAALVEAHRKMTEARSRIANLSPREREVLDWLAKGSTNKAIARVLGISPRTVEIHRANMMDKLDARHLVEAVRLRLEAEFESAAHPTSDHDDGEDADLAQRQ